jgi:hypothetical protein
MSEFLIVSIILLGIIAIDAAGDAFRIHQWQIAHHSMEAVTVGAWISIWALFEFSYLYIIMYITCRIWLFDPLLNLIAGYRLTYSGKSSLYGRLLSWFQSKVKEPGHLIWAIRAIALIWWVAWLLSDANHMF